MTKFYFGFNSYFFGPGRQMVRGGVGLCSELHETLISGDAAPGYAVSGFQFMLMSGDAAPGYAVSGFQLMHMSGDAAPSSAVSGFQPDKLDSSTISRAHNTLSGHRPDTSKIGTSSLCIRITYQQ